MPTSVSVLQSLLSPLLYISPAHLFSYQPRFHSNPFYSAPGPSQTGPASSNGPFSYDVLLPSHRLSALCSTLLESCTAGHRGWVNSVSLPRPHSTQAPCHTDELCLSQVSPFELRLSPSCLCPLGFLHRPCVLSFNSFIQQLCMQHLFYGRHENKEKVLPPWSLHFMRGGVGRKTQMYMP